MFIIVTPKSKFVGSDQVKVKYKLHVLYTVNIHITLFMSWIPQFLF